MKISASATVIPVSDLEASVQFFTQKFGFKQTFRQEDYVGLEWDNCLVHLFSAANPNAKAAGSATVYIFCDDVDLIYQNLVDLGASIESEPQDYSYGMRDFEVADLDGNKFCFGSPVSETESS